MSHPIITIIVPVYKVEQYLSQCIESILKQTFKDFEVLLIDDGSPDNSGQICDQYANKDSRIQVVHKKNRGVSSARNAGIKSARGTWICFVDSDDELKSNYLENFIQCLNKKEADLYVAGYTKKTPYSSSNFSLKDQIYTYENREQAIINLKNKVLFGIPWNKMFKTEIIHQNKLLFDESLDSYEDELFVLNYIYYARTIYISSAITYLYNITNSSSLSQKYIPIERHFDTAQTLLDAGVNISKNNEFINFLQMEYTWHLYRCITLLYRGTLFHRKDRIHIIKRTIQQAKLSGHWNNFKHLFHKKYIFLFNPYFLDFTGLCRYILFKLYTYYQKLKY